MKIRLLFTLILSLAAAPHVLAQEAAVANLTSECVSEYNADTDYFPQESTITYAEGFGVEYFNNYKVVTVSTPDGEDDVALYQYVLVQCGTPAPDDMPEGAQVIEVPIETVVTTSTTYLPFLDQLGVVDSLIGVDNTAYVNNETVIERIEAGAVEQVGGDEGLNLEVLVDLEPSLVMASPFDTEAVENIIAADVPVAVNADYLESTPLGRAEWGKFVALFFNAEATAEENFVGIVERYENLQALTSEVEDRPTVFLSTPYEATWYMAAGNSYAAQLLEDAGADYLWSDSEEAGALVLDFESVFDRAAEADFWLNPDQLFWNTLEDVVTTDERFGDFGAYQSGNIYNNNVRLNEAGWNDYYESAVANPDVVLSDLIAIFHPELLPDHELYYYRKLDR